MFSSSALKQIVGVAITPNVGLEMILLDPKTRTAEKYGRRNVEYNLSKRDIEDYSALKGSLTELFEELAIPKKSKVYIVLPNVHFGFMSLPSNLEEDAIRAILLAKAEESYIFKKTEPIIAYDTASQNAAVENQYLVYSAIQNDTITQLKDICTDLGYELAGVEGSYSAIFRGIDYWGAMFDQISQTDNWNLLLINNNSYAIFALKGNNIFDYNEVPIAVKSIGYEEAYRELAESIAQNLPNYPATKLLIMSQNDDISAGVLKTQLVFEGEIETLEANKYTKQSLIQHVPMIDNEEALYMSPSAVGAGSAGTSQIAFELNIFGPLSKKGGGQSQEFIRFDLIPGQEYVITPEMVGIVCVVTSIVIGAILAILYFAFLMPYDEELREKISSLESEKAEIVRQIDELSAADKGIDINTLISNIISNNKKLISYYDSLSMDIPKNIWLTYFYGREGDNVAVEGMSLGINEVYEYYKGIKNSIPTSTVKLMKLQALTDITDNSYDPNAKNELKLYNFEISNTQSKKMGGGIASPSPSAGSGDGSMPDGTPPALDPIN